MIRFLADHDFNERILHGLKRREPTIDIVPVREIGLAAAPDPAVLEWAAADGRVILTHDRQTMPAFARARVAAGEPMPGLFLVNKSLPLGAAVDEIVLAAHCLSEEECQDMITFFPL